jgi:hypothetical protein
VKKMYAGPAKVHNDETGPADSIDGSRHETAGNNLLISNFDRYHEHGHEHEAVVYITERYRYTPIPDGYRETVRAQGDRERVRVAVARALDYARQKCIPVQINNPHVRADIAAGNVYDLTGITIADALISEIRERVESAEGED